jgi:SsrA-binding protein
VVLHGWEVKALREGKVQLTDGYVLIKEGEMFLLGCQINPLKTASTHVNPDAARIKKLLLKKNEIKRLTARSNKKATPWCPSTCTGRTAS